LDIDFELLLEGKEYRMENDLAPENHGIYDTDSAVAFICKATGIIEAQVLRVVCQRDVLQEVFGLTSEANPDVDVAALREKYRGVIHQSNIEQRFMSYETEATFIQGETGLPMKVVVDVLAADFEYMAKQGIVDSDAVACYRGWASGWVEREWPTAR
jgi:hypothetical protein